MFDNMSEEEAVKTDMGFRVFMVTKIAKMEQKLDDHISHADSGGVWIRWFVAPVLVAVVAYIASAGCASTG
jgi:hypothetical protein